MISDYSRVCLFAFDLHVEVVVTIPTGNRREQIDTTGANVAKGFRRSYGAALQTGLRTGAAALFA